ncbi:MAG: complex I NDUFA9 subunit family protein [Kiloniellaceae bacterium]
MSKGLVTVFGGSGFIGRHLVQRLARQGWLVRVAVRHPSTANHLKTLGDVGQVVPVRAPVQDEIAVAEAVAGASAVVNLVGVLYERGRQNFAAIHAQGARTIAAAAAAAGATRLTHVSAIGADPHAEAEYARSKGVGEAAVEAAFAGATILRPSVVFGPEDDFLNRFAVMAKFSPVLPLIGGGGTRFQPVYVGDVAEAIARALNSPKAAGQTYELGGPKVYTFKELMELILREIRRKRLLVPVPFALANMQAAFLEYLPVPPLTRDQVRMLRHDNVVSPGAAGLPDLGIAPTSIEVIAPTYLERHRPGGQFNKPLLA